MKKAWLCDYCGRFGSEEEIKEHEDSCVFNPKNKTCHTCMHSYEDGSLYEGFYNECRKKLSVSAGMDDGNCSGWEWENQPGKILKI